MSEYFIQKPCDNCELKELLRSDEGLGVLALNGLYTAVFEKNAFKGCKHPWRILFQVYHENPNPQEVQILSKVVEVRGRNPRDYSLPIVDKISTLDI